MEQQFVQQQSDELKIDFVKLSCALLHKWKVIVLSTLVCALVALVATLGLAAQSEQMSAELALEQPQASYTASINVYYIDGYLELASMVSHSMETSFAGDLQAFAVSRPVLEGVIDDLALEMDYETLVTNVKVSVATNTHILTLAVVDEDAQQAQDVVEAWQLRFCDYVVQVMDISAPAVLTDVTIREEVVVETDTTSGTSELGIVKGVGLGALVGFILSIGCIFICPIIFGFGDNVRKAMKEEQ